MNPLNINIPSNWNLITLISFWYLFSFSTLTFNKYIVSSLQGDPVLLGKRENNVRIRWPQSKTFYCSLLGSFQLMLCTIVGYYQLRWQSSTKLLILPPPNESIISFSKFSKSLFFVGCLRWLISVMCQMIEWYGSSLITI